MPSTFDVLCVQYATRRQDIWTNRGLVTHLCVFRYCMIWLLLQLERALYVSYHRPGMLVMILICWHTKPYNIGSKYIYRLKCHYWYIVTNGCWRSSNSSSSSSSSNNSCSNRSRSGSSSCSIISCAPAVAAVLSIVVVVAVIIVIIMVLAGTYFEIQLRFSWTLFNFLNKIYQMGRIYTPLVYTFYAGCE